MHFAAWLDGRRVGARTRSTTTRTTSPARWRVLEAMRRRRRASASSSRRPAPSTASRQRCRSSRRIRQRPINAYGETKLAIERALPHLERAHGIRWIALRYFNAAGARSRRLDRRGSRPGDPPDSARHRAAHGGTPLKVFGEDYPTPDGTCLRDYIHVCDLADAHVRALERARARRRRRRPTTSAPARRTRCEQVIDAVGRVVGRAGAVAVGAAPAGRSGGTLRRQRPRRSASWAGARSTPTSRRSSGTRGSGTRRIHGGTYGSSQSPDRLMDAFLRLLRYATPAPRRHRRRGRWRWWSTARPSAALA